MTALAKLPKQAPNKKAKKISKYLKSDNFFPSEKE